MVFKTFPCVKSYGFKQSYADYSLFIFITGSVSFMFSFMLMILLLRGLLMMSLYLHCCFHMKDLGPLKYFLGIEVGRGSEGIFLFQRKYALDVLNKVGVLSCKPIVTPMEQNRRLAFAKGNSYDHPDRYRRLVGRLVYL